jgi:hypothetical protein
MVCMYEGSYWTKPSFVPFCFIFSKSLTILSRSTFYVLHELPTIFNFPFHSRMLNQNDLDHVFCLIHHLSAFVSCAMTKGRAWRCQDKCSVIRSTSSLIFSLTFSFYSVLFVQGSHHQHDGRWTYDKPPCCDCSASGLGQSA